MGTSGMTVATDATCSRTVQSNASRQHFNVGWFDDVRVDDEGQQSEQNEGDRNLCDGWNDKVGNWVQNEMTSGHKTENLVENEMMNGHETENWNNRSGHRDWIQSKMTDGHKRWNNRIWYRN